MQAIKNIGTKGGSVNLWGFWLITILSLFLYNVPIIGLLMAPVNTFATAVHEMSHAFVCMATGGWVSGMTIVADGEGHGGLTFCHGGLAFLYTQAGYLGTAVFGSILIYLSQYPKMSKALLCLMGAVMGLASIFLVGLNILNTGWQGFFSMVWGLALAAFLLWAGMKWKPQFANMMLLFLAVQTALNSVQSLIFLAQVSLGTVPFGTFSDATSMAQMTHIPAGFWSVFWVLSSLFMVVGTIMFTYGRGLVPRRLAKH
jgi:hypothetical protein